MFLYKKQWFLPSKVKKNIEMNNKKHIYQQKFLFNYRIFEGIYRT